MHVDSVSKVMGTSSAPLSLSGGSSIIVRRRGLPHQTSLGARAAPAAQSQRAIRAYM